MNTPAVRALQIEGRTVRVFEGWRAPSGLGLAYFAVEDDEGSDRRGILDADDDLDTMTDAAIEARWEDAAALTSTERRLIDGHGRYWLVQGVGPVWAERGAAADAVGIRLRCLSEELPPLDLTGTSPDRASKSELLRALERHLGPAEV